MQTKAIMVILGVLLISIIFSGCVEEVQKLFTGAELAKKNDCIKQADASLEIFKLNLELAGQGGVERKSILDSVLSDCVSDGSSTVTLLNKDSDPLICSRHCSTSRTECVLLRSFSPSNSITKCVNIKFSTQFLIDPSVCGTEPDFSLINPLQSISLPAELNFKNVTPAGSTESQICVFAKKVV